MREAAIVTAHTILVRPTVVAARLVIESLRRVPLSRAARQCLANRLNAGSLIDSDRTVIPPVVAVNAFARRAT
jgi:hypothetical protein